MISLSAQYAARATMHLVRAGTWQTCEDLAAITGIPQGYLAKIMQSLNRAGIIGSQRGINGGYLASRRPEEISLLEVVRAVDPPSAYGACQHCQAGPAGTSCAVNRVFAGIEADAERVLRTTTIRDLLMECSPERVA
jgi:Rrf2 family nitric oxide-sensitive transcriptional repressor